MISVTRYVLKHPVTTIMCLLCLLVFGISSVLNATLEQMPAMETPTLMINARYSGAGPEDIDELLTQPIEDALSTMEGVDSIESQSSDGSARIQLTYDYGTNIDEAYEDVKKQIDNLERRLPEDATVSVMQMAMNSSTTMMLTITHDRQDRLYDYVDQQIVPEFEKLSSVASVDSMGGSSEYVRVELQSDRMAQYHVTMDSVINAISSANAASPSGTAVSGNLELSVTASLETNTVSDLQDIPLLNTAGKLVTVGDVAVIYMKENENGGISRYNGEERVSISLSKNQSSTAMEVSRQAKEAIAALEKDDPYLHIEIANDSADSIIDSLRDVAQTMVLAVVISMVVIFLFFGDVKASLIVGSSIPVSILMSLIVLTATGNSLNVITMSAIVLGVGMMVDNSIVVLESCFRETADEKKKGIFDYYKSALRGTNIVAGSIFGSTVTTCVVFLPMTRMNGMTGQMFRPLGFTVVYCMVASLLSAMCIVPICYVAYKPAEARRALLAWPIDLLQRGYRALMRVLLRHRWLVMCGSIGIIIATFLLASGMQAELMTSDDTGTVSVSIQTRPGLVQEKVTEALEEAEAIVASDENVESYMLRYRGNSGSLTAYLKDKEERTMGTEDVADLWQEEMTSIENASITVSASASMSFMGRSRGYSVLLQGTDYDELKRVSDKIVSDMTGRTDIINVHSSLENNAPVIALKVDPEMSKAYGFTASSIGTAVNRVLSGSNATTLTIDGRDVNVQVAYPEGEYRTVNQLSDIMLTAQGGKSVPLTELVDVTYRDSPSSISRSNKEYQVTISASYTSAGGSQAVVSNTVTSECVLPNLSGTVTIGTNSRDRMQQTEFSAIYVAIGYAVFLVFVVMAAQFESLKYSLMVMTTIPFSLVGSFLFLKIANVSISMTSLLGFLILVGTVVNNGILFVDTANQYRHELSFNRALIEAGATRIRPILMTSLTTILAMIPMAMAFGSSGSTTQGLAVVDIGGLTMGIFVALLMLPVFYSLMTPRRQREQILVERVLELSE